MSNWIKPPLGVSPGWYVYTKRIIELTESMLRYAIHIEKHRSRLKTEQKIDYFRVIAVWAREVAHLCDMCAEMAEKEEI